MQAAYHAEALGSETSFLVHPHIVPRPAPGTAYPFGYHQVNYGDSSGAVRPHLFLPAGYNSVAPGSYPVLGADAAAIVQPQAYALSGLNYASPLTAALATTPLLNAVQSSLATVPSNAASEMQHFMSSPGQAPTPWAPENTPSCSENGCTAATVGHAIVQHPFAGLQVPGLQAQQHQPRSERDTAATALGPLTSSLSGFPAMLAAPGGYGVAMDAWKHIAMVAAARGVQSTPPVQMRPPYGVDIQIPFVQQQHAATAALHMQAAYMQQQQQPMYAATASAMPPLRAATVSASLGNTPQTPAAHGLVLGSSAAPAHMLQQFLHQQQKMQQQQQPLQSVVTPESLSDPALAAAAATALHLLQLPASLRALAACGMMPHLLLTQQSHPQALQLPSCSPASAASYASPGLLAASLQPLMPAAYSPCEPFTPAIAGAEAAGQPPFQVASGAQSLLASHLATRQTYGSQNPLPGGVSGYPLEGGPDISDPRLQQLPQLVQQPQLQAQMHPPPSSQQLPTHTGTSFSPEFAEPQRQQQQQQQGERQQAETYMGRQPSPPPRDIGAAAGRDSLAGSLSAPSSMPVDDEPCTEEASSPSPTREPSSAPSGHAPRSALQPTSAALLLFGLQQQQQQQKQQQQKQQPVAVFHRGVDLPPKLSAELSVQPSPRNNLLQIQLPPPPVLHFAGMPLQLPLPHAVLQAASYPALHHLQQPALSCPPASARGLPAGAAVAGSGPATACTSTSAPASALETRRRTQVDRRERRKESNRESARRCRLRREKDTCDLSRRVTAQEAVNGNVAGQLQRLEQATAQLLEQNSVLEAWLKHIQSAGDVTTATAAASTILGYVRNMDEQLAAAAAAVQLQAVTTQGAYETSDAMAAQAAQNQNHLAAAWARDLQDQQLHPQQEMGWLRDAAAASAAGTAGGAVGRELLGGHGLSASVTRDLAAGDSTAAAEGAHALMRNAAQSGGWLWSSCRGDGGFAERDDTEDMRLSETEDEDEDGGDDEDLEQQM